VRGATLVTILILFFLFYNNILNILFNLPYYLTLIYILRSIRMDIKN